MSEENNKTESKQSGGGCWPEISKALESKRYELCLTGAEIKKRVEENNGELDKNLFRLNHLNFLEIAKTSLSKIPTEISLITNLTQFICHSNEIVEIPEGSVGALVNLKNLDLSNNKLTKLPADFSNLKELATVNLSVNQLTELFPLGDFVKLAVLDINHNKLRKLPDDICSKNLENLSTIDASSNEIAEIPIKMTQLPSLKLLNLENNQILHVPSNLSQCFKLKDLLLKENKLKDNRLKKLVDQNKAKAIIEYLERIYAEENKSNNKKKSNPLVPAEPSAPVSLIDSQKKAKAASSAVDQEYDLIKVMHAHNKKDETLNARDVVVSEMANSIRPYIICAIFRSLDLQTTGNFKKFISIQTKIQDETCQKRANGTIATHDLALLKNNLTYDASEPEKISFVPLGRKNPMTALEYYEKLVDEAESERKQKKRNVVSGVYKYLGLVEGQKYYPFIKDESDTIISLPPLSNSDKTRMSAESKDIFVEVSSTLSMDFCKQVMEELISEMLKAGITSTESINSQIESIDLNAQSLSDQQSNMKKRNTLIIQQVRVLDGQQKKLKWVYPSRVDLNFENNSSKVKTHVVRLYDENLES